jgi:O-antigen ligase
MAVSALSAVATASAVLLSGRLSAQVALLASVLTFPLAMVRRRDFVRALAILFCLGFALILPFSLYAYGFRAAPWLPENSQRVRVVFLGQIAERALEHPWFGIGAESSPALKESLKTAELPEGFKFPRKIAHPHDFFLQTWYELGLVGAILFALAGVALLLRIPLLPLEAQPFASASFVTLATAATFAWSMWQTWLVCMAGLVILYLRVAAAAAGREDSRQAARL